MNQHAKQARTGFTIIELLVVIAVLAVLLAMLLPAIQKTIARSRTVRCVANLRQIGNAFSTYQSVYTGYLPPVNSYISHMNSNPAYDWSLAKNYGMWTALGQFVGLPEWGGVKDPASNPSAPVDQYTGYLKWDSYWGKSQGGGKKFRKSVFLCPETWTYGDDALGAFSGSGYGESTYLQRYPSGAGGSHLATGGPNPAATTSGIGLPRPIGAIKNPSMAIHVAEKGGDNHSGSPKWMPGVDSLTPANYPPKDRGSPYDDFDMYRHNGGSNILFADGHVTYYRGTEVLKNIVNEPDDRSQRNYNLR